MDGRSYQRAQTPLAVEMNGVKAPGEMPSPDSSVTLFGDDANIWKGPAVYHQGPSNVQPTRLYKDAINTLPTSSGDIGIGVGIGQQLYEPNGDARRTLRSPVPTNLLSTSNDSIGTTGSSSGRNGSIWSVGNSGGIGLPEPSQSPKTTWATLDAGSETTASVLRSGSLWDPETSNDFTEGQPSFDSDFNRSFETLNLEDNASVASAFGTVYSPGNANANNQAGSSYTTPSRPSRPSFSGSMGLPSQTRNLLSTPPAKNFQGFAGYTTSNESSPMGSLGPSPAQRKASGPIQPFLDASPGYRNPMAPSFAPSPRLGSSTYLASYEIPTSWPRPSSCSSSHYDPPAQRSHDIPTRSLWIGNLDPNVDATHLVGIFSEFGTIESLRVLRDRDCAFVNFNDLASAVRARGEMEGARIGSTAVRIGYGRVERDMGMEREQAPTRSVWVGNLPTGLEAEELRMIFRQFGGIESARVLTHKNCGFINFDRLENAVDAVRTMHGSDLGGNQIRLGYAKVPGREPDFRSGSAQGSDGQPVGSPEYPWLEPVEQQQISMELQLPLFEISAPSPAAHVSAPITAPVLTGINGDEFSQLIPELPEPRMNRHVDQTRLREMRRRLDALPFAGPTSMREVDVLFGECEEDFLDLSTDYIGNVVLQKILERAGDHHRQRFINVISPYLAAIGIHKNGTWLVQKIIQLARTSQQMDAIVMAVRPYTVQLLLDQVGNYVVQGCLKLGEGKNQFVFDAMSMRCLEIATGRYGARAMRTALELPITTATQAKQVAASVVRSALHLATNPNGVLLVTWLLETSGIPSRYRMLAPQFAQHVAQLACDKLASTIIVKLVNQRLDSDAKESMLDALFFADGWPQGLQEMLSDYAHGVPLLQKILTSTYVDPDVKIQAADRIRQVLASSAMEVARNSNAGYRRLLDELRMLPVGLEGRQAVAALANVGVDAGLSPLRGGLQAERGQLFGAEGQFMSGNPASFRALPQPQQQPPSDYNGVGLGTRGTPPAAVGNANGPTASWHSIYPAAAANPGFQHQQQAGKSPAFNPGFLPQGHGGAGFGLPQQNEPRDTAFPL